MNARPNKNQLLTIYQGVHITHFKVTGKYGRPLNDEVFGKIFNAEAS